MIENKLNYVLTNKILIVAQILETPQTKRRPENASRSEKCIGKTSAGIAY